MKYKTLLLFVCASFFFTQCGTKRGGKKEETRTDGQIQSEKIIINDEDRTPDASMPKDTLSIVDKGALVRETTKEIMPDMSIEDSIPEKDIPKEAPSITDKKIPVDEPPKEITPKKTYTDQRDGQTYPIIALGGRTWMAKNLNYNLPGNSWCYNNSIPNCTRYGRIYRWQTAQRVCPTGWHLSTDDDWKSLERALGMSVVDSNLTGYSINRGSNEGSQLKTGGNSGMNIELAGFWSRGQYQFLGQRTYFWVAGLAPPGQVWRRRLEANSNRIYRFTNPAGDFSISVRCVKD